MFLMAIRKTNNENDDQDQLMNVKSKLNGEINIENQYWLFHFRTSWVYDNRSNNSK